ncbi:MAG: carbamate kinase, carbamate kinase [Chloroflexi bacterium CSP1-4]|nr:MAG: carbamate kinase, carbamate kinase [Chloroflexi bacterium CSP1-4]
MERRAVIAIGGNALILDGQKGTIAEQYQNARETSRHIASLVKEGWSVVLTHGNGPQVGFILLRSELVGDTAPVPALSLEMCVADSQGGIGHILGQALLNELAARGEPDRVACILTHTVVAASDPAFGDPTKPIGPYYTEAEANRKRERQGWSIVEDAGRGYRRVVASPRPLRIVETAQIKSLVEGGFIVIAVGGGGIPVVEESPGSYRGVEAVIDKDRASALLAASLGVPLLVLSTGVEQVAVHFRRPDQRWLERITVSEAKQYLEEGEFPKGSMGPKVEAAVSFLERGGQEVLITTPAALERAIAGETGTRIVPDPVPLRV